MERRGERLKKDYHRFVIKFGQKVSQDTVTATAEELRRAYTICNLVAEEKYDDLVAFTETEHPRFVQETGIIICIRNPISKENCEPTIELLVPRKNHPHALAAIETTLKK